MKHIISCLFLLLSISIFAEDTIALVNHQLLVANIKSISKDEVCYRDPSMPDGPDFILKMDEVASITFKNGLRKVYNAYAEENSVIAKKEETSVQSSDNEDDNGYEYVSEDGKIKLNYNFADRIVHIKADKPLMLKNNSGRTISTVHFHFGEKTKYLVFDMTTKVEGTAILSGWYSWNLNIEFHTYFKKHMPKTFIVEIPYETERVSYKMKLTN